MYVAVSPWHRSFRPLQFSPLECLGFHKIVVCGKQNQSSCLGVQPSLTAATKELSHLAILRRHVANCHVKCLNHCSKPSMLRLALVAQQQNTFITFAKKNQAGFPKQQKNNKRRNSSKSFCFTKGRNQEGPPKML